MKTKIIIFITLLVLLTCVTSCTKDPDIPTGKVFNAGSSGGSTTYYTISVSANPSNGGTVGGGGTYSQGQSCTVTATANSGYAFNNWTKNGSIVSSSASYTFTVSITSNLVANFARQYTITVSANPSNGGVVDGGGVYNQGQNCTVTAMPASGYVFTDWTENGSVVSNNASYGFNVTSNRTLVATFTQPQVPTGAINGLFTINSSGGKVWFSKGNLQYKASSNTWGFAENQWDYVGTQIPGVQGYVGGNVIGSDNASISQNYNGWIDLFGWGTSGWNNGNIYYYPWDSQAVNNTSQGYGYGPTDGISYTFNLTGVYANADWGVYNSISGGGSQAGQWRTLTMDEWSYVFNTRSTCTVNGIDDARYAKAMVANVQGVILFPDSYVHPFGVTQPLGINESGIIGWNGNNYSENDFALMQEAGAVFLPVGGTRIHTTVNGAGHDGYYWSASCESSSYAYCVHIDDSNLESMNHYSGRQKGNSVRLVQVAK